MGVAFAEKPPLGSAAARSGRPESDARRDGPGAPGFPGTRSRHGARHGARADAATAAAYGALVAEQADATRRLAEILKKDLRDLAVLRRENALRGAAAKTTPQHVPYY